MNDKDIQALQRLACAIQGSDLFPELLRQARRVPRDWAAWPLNRCLWYLRKRRHLTQQALAERAGIARSHVARIEAGYDARLSTLTRVFSALRLGLIVLPTNGVRHAQQPWPGPWRRSRESPR